MWNSHRKCPGYMSEEHYEQYLRQQDKEAERLRSKPSAVTRREEAKLRHTEPHYDGRHANKPKPSR